MSSGEVAMALPSGNHDVHCVGPTINACIGHHRANSRAKANQKANESRSDIVMPKDCKPVHVSRFYFTRKSFGDGSVHAEMGELGERDYIVVLGNGEAMERFSILYLGQEGDYGQLA